MHINYSSSTNRRVSPALTVILMGILIRLPLLFIPFENTNDMWRQSDTASIARHFLLNGFKLFYPQVYWGGNGPGYVETEFQLHPLIVSLLYAAFGEHVWLGRLVSLLFTVLALVFFYLLARRLLATKAALVALAFFAVSPLYIRYGDAFMPDATTICFFVAALYFFQRWLDNQRLSALLVASACTAVAIMVKATSIQIGLIFAVLALERYGLPVLKRGGIWLAGAIAVIPGALWYAHARNLYLVYGNTFGILSGGDSKFGNLEYWLSPSFYWQLAKIETEWVFGGLAVLIFCAGIAVALKNRQLHLVIVGALAVGIYYVTLARYTAVEWGLQYHIFAMPFAALAVGLGFDWLAGRLRPAIWTPISLFLVASTLVWSGYQYWRLFQPADSLVYRHNLMLLNCASHVERLVPEHDLVIISTINASTYPDGAANNYQEPMIFFYSHRYGWSLPADWHTAAQVEALRQAGASYFVIYSQDLYNANQGLADYLDKNAVQIGPGVDASCGIYQLKKE
jgi:4-amino-4-deoxy-L-arabinose transferase-like glycosyltransferase